MEEENKVESLDETTTTPVVETMEPVTESPTTAPVEPASEAAPAEPVTEAPSEATAAEPATEANVPAPEEAPAPKKKSGGILLILLILVLIVFAVWFFVLGGNEMLGLKKKAKEPAQQEEKQEDKIEAVNLSEEEQERLIKYVPYDRSWELNNDLYTAYDSKKVSVEEMNINWLMVNAMDNVKEEGECTEEQFQANDICAFTLSKENVEKEFKKLYGNINVTYPTVVDKPFLNKCTLVDDVYACSNQGGSVTSKVLWYFNLPGVRFFTRFQKAEKDGKNLYVYVKYAKLEMVYDEHNNDIQPGDITFRIRKYGTGNEVIDETILSGADYYEDYDGTNHDYKSPFYDKLYEQFKDKLTTYKITYAIDSNEYHLTSVEPVK